MMIGCVGIGRTKARAVEREQSVDYESKQRQEWQEPEPFGQAPREWVRRAGRGRSRLQQGEHHPLRRLMSFRLIVCRWRKMAMIIASPTAASAAETVMTKTTKTWPAAP